MKVKITDREALGALKTTNIEKWLVEHEWVLDAERWTEYTKGGEYVLLPSDECADFPLRVSELFDVIEEIEGISQLAIYEGMIELVPKTKIVFEYKLYCSAEHLMVTSSTLGECLLRRSNQCPKCDGDADRGWRFVNVSGPSIQGWESICLEDYPEIEEST